MGAAPSASHMLIAAGRTIVLNVYLFVIDPQGLFPAAGHRPADRRHPGRPEHLVPADEAEARRSSSRSSRTTRRSRTWSASPAGSGGGGGRPIPASSSSSLKPLGERDVSVDQVIAPAAAATGAGARRALFFQAAQDLRAGGAAEQRAYQYTLQGDDLARALRVGAEARRGAAAARPAGRRQLRPAAKGLETDLVDRPRHRGAARHDGEPDRQHALRRLRPAPGLDHLQRRSTSITS